LKKPCWERGKMLILFCVQRPARKCDSDGLPAPRSSPSMVSDPPILDGEPDFVGGLLKAIAKVGETPCDDGLEALAESGRAPIIQRVHIG
jgi:hypothetical protein